MKDLKYYVEYMEGKELKIISTDSLETAMYYYNEKKEAGYKIVHIVKKWTERHTELVM
jgi:benzoyl-CoA reductase/2-hydroxyglutaryl-CoA dehydratase subunit BcrC/BadD/HgdB